MKILQISTPFLPVKKGQIHAGTERIVYSLDAELSRWNHDSFVAAPKLSEPTGTLLATIKESISSDQHATTKAIYLRIEHLAKALQYAQHDFEVVHVHDENFLVFMPLLKTPSLLTLHLDSAEYFWNSEIHPDIVDIPIPLVAVSRNQQQLFRTAGFTVDQVIYNGINLKDFSFAQEKSNFLLSLGRITPSKGQHTALEVGRKTRIDTLVAGNVEDRDYFQTFVQPQIRYDLSGFDDKLKGYHALLNDKSPKTIYLGPVNDLQKEPLFAHAKAFLMPIDWEEPFGLVMIEAMACGTPVIAFNRGAVPEIVKDGKTGYIVNTIDEMCEAVQKVDRIKPEDCRRHVEQNFSVERMANDYLQLYAELISGRKP